MAGINKLLRNESKIMLFILAGPFAIGLVLVFLLPQLYQESQIDICLDAGGSFNYEACACDFNQSHIVPKQHNCKQAHKNNEYYPKKLHFLTGALLTDTNLIFGQLCITKSNAS